MKEWFVLWDMFVHMKEVLLSENFRYLWKSIPICLFELKSENCYQVHESFKPLWQDIL